MKEKLERRVVKLPEIHANDLASRENIRELAKTVGITPGKAIYNIPFGLIVIREGFNKRMDFGDLELLADGIIESGGPMHPIIVDILKDGTCILNDGERTYRAYLIINMRGIEGFEKIPALVNSKDVTELDRLLAQYNANNTKRFNDLEEADYFKFLKETQGLSVTEIAKKTSNNKMHVSNRLRLAGVNEEERGLIEKGSVSTTAIVDMIKANIEPQRRIAAVKKAAETGQKVKVADVVSMRAEKNDILPGTAPDPMPPGATNDDIIKDVLNMIKTLDIMLASDSKALDLTFKMDQRLRELRAKLKIDEDKSPF